MAIRLARDTKESVQVQITDASQVVTDLATSTPTYEVFKIDGTTVVVAATPASAVGMTIYCLLDTTAWPAEDEYLLFVNFTVGGEIPRQGPFYINLT